MMPQSRQGRRTFSFRDGGLVVSRSGTEICRIRAWPVPVAEKTDRIGNWMRFCPEYRFIYPASTLPQKTSARQMELGLAVDPTPLSCKCSRKEAYQRLRQTIPEPFADRLQAFRSHQWNPLLFLSKDERFAELLDSTPSLAFLIANKDAFRMRVFHGYMEIEEIIRTPQADLMRRLGMPGKRSAIKLLRKLHPESISMENMELLRKLLSDSTLLPWVRHLKSINTGVLHLLCRDPKLVAHLTPSLIKDVCDSPQSRYSIFAFITLAETVRLCRLDREGGRPVPVFRNLDELQALHTELMLERDKRMEEIKPGPFPSPPFKGTKSIIPLKSEEELREEGRSQHNCVGAYGPFVRMGQKYIYSIQAPQRATLAIDKQPDGKWVLGELRGACNKEAGIETFRAVEEWLEDRQEGMGE